MNRCIIRRTQALLSKYLPVKIEQVVCVKMTSLQEDIYQSFVHSDAIRRSLRGIYVVVRVFILGSCFWNYGKFSASEQSGGNAKMSSSSLAAITALKKLVNHPDLIHEHCRDKKEGFENALQHYPQVICDSSAYA